MQVGMGRLYVVEFHAIAVTAQQDLFYLKPAADKMIVLEQLYVAASGGAADAGDAQEELLEVRIVRLNATVTVGSGGTAPTPTPQLPGDSAAGFTARVNDTTKATATTTNVLHADALNNRSPYQWPPAPEHRFPAINAGAIAVELDTTPADSILLNGTALVREIA